MDVSKLVKDVVRILTPLLPHLPKGEKAIEDAGETMTQQALELATTLWMKLAPHLKANPGAKRAIEDLVAMPQNKDAQASLRLQLGKLLQQNQALAQEIGHLLKPAETDIDMSGSSTKQGDIWGSVSDSAVASGAQSVAQRGERNYNLQFERASGFAIGDGAKVFSTQVEGDLWGNIVQADEGSAVTIDQSAGKREIHTHFAPILDQIKDRPEDPDVDKAEITGTVKNIRDEAAKGEKANPNKIERWIAFLAEVAPDIGDVVVETLKNPIAGVAEVVRKIAARAKKGKSS